MKRAGEVLYDCLDLPSCGAVGGRCLCRRRLVTGNEPRRPEGVQAPRLAAVLPAPKLGDLFPELARRWSVDRRSA